MEFPPQAPIFRVITEELVVSKATTINIQALSGDCVVTTRTGSITVPENNAIEIKCDVGNTLSDFTITPAGTAQVIWFN